MTKRTGKAIDVADDLAKGNPVPYEKFKIAFKWATKEEQEALRNAHPGFADRAENDKER